ncbi:hypothetical protein VTN31DRAFT_4410 [Thermomyces dupontii]|uniref:uncharacterized protein n=1 Tax=Talaromyces thermophilus TaxID=28565 RepID=UPI003742CA16
MSTVEMAAAAFSTADAVTAPPAFDAGGAFNADFLGMAFHDDDDSNAAWGFSPLSPTLPAWNAKTDPSFPVSLSLDPELKPPTATAQMNNGQPTPPLDEKPSLVTASELNMASYPAAADGKTNRGQANPAPAAPAWNDAPTPPSADTTHRRKSSGGGSSSARGGGGTDNRGPVTKRRRSARGHKPTAHHRMTSSSGADSDDPDPEQLKRERFLERNRLAASKCRQKKKEHTMQLESKFKEQSDKRDELNAEISALRGQILALKNEVLKHAQCGDEPIKLHLAQMVKQITYRDSQDPHAHGLADCSAAAAAAAAAVAASAAPLSASASASASALVSGSAVPDAQSSTPSSSSPVHGGISFGFDEQLHMDSSTSFEQQIRRDSEASMAFSADDDFDNLINV